MKYVYMILISFVFWNFGYVAYSTIYGLTLAFGMPDSTNLNLVVKVVLVPFALYFGFKVVTQELTKREGKQKKELTKKPASQE